MSDPVDRVLAALEPFAVRPCGTGWIAKCPAHEDRQASLCIGIGDDGRVLLCCHRGCGVRDIVGALGLRLRDLFPALEQTIPQTVYNYRDESGHLLFQVVRIQKPTGKTFTQRRPDGHGGWEWSVAGVQRVLYRLPELRAADPATEVFLVEGEKDADNLARLGLVATTNPGGAGKWRNEYSLALRGRRVVVLPDNDDVGRTHAAYVARALRGLAASVKVLALPGLPDKGDVSDWMKSGGTAERLRQLARNSPRTSPQSATDSPKGDHA